MPAAEPRAALDFKGSYRHYQPPNARPVCIEGRAILLPAEIAGTRHQICELATRDREITIIHEYSLLGFDAATFDRLSMAAAFEKVSWSVGRDRVDVPWDFKYGFHDATVPRRGFGLLRQHTANIGAPVLVFAGKGIANINILVNNPAVGQVITATGWLLLGSLQGYQFTIPRDSKSDKKLRFEEALKEILGDLYPQAMLLE